MKCNLTTIIVLVFATAAFTQSVFSQESDVLRAEAERFVVESRFLHDQHRYAEALEKAEAATALAPEAKAVRERLIHALLNVSLDAVCPGWAMNTSASPESYPRVTPEQMRRSLELAERVVHLKEKYADHAAGQSQLSSLRKHWNVILKYRTDEVKDDVAALNRRVFKDWVEKSYEPAKERHFGDTGNAKTLAKFKDILYVSLCHVAVNQDPKDAAVFFEAITTDILRAKFEWRNTGSVGDILRVLFRELEKFAAEYRDLPSDERDPAADASLNRTATMLENDPRVIVQVHSWFVRNKIDYFKNDSLRFQDAANAYFLRLEEGVKQFPHDITETEYSVFYEEAATLLWFCHGEKFDRAAEMLEIAGSRNEFAAGLTERLLSALKDFPGTEDEKARFAPLISRQIEIGLKSSPKRARAMELDALGAGISVSQTAPGKLWKEEIVLFESGRENHFESYRNPFLRDDTLYLFMTDHPTMRLTAINLKTLKRTDYPAAQTWYRAGGKEAEVSYVDAENAYYGACARGVLVFPLDGSEPWALGPEDGLPGDRFQGLASLGGKLYAGIEDTQQRSWLIAIDLKTRQWETLASSTAKEGTLPFTDMSPGARYRAFYPDTPRNRLLMFVDIIHWLDNPLPSRWKLSGLWSLDTTTGVAVQLNPRVSSAQPGHVPFGEKRALFRNSYGIAMLLDLEKAGEDGACEYLCHNHARRWDWENQRYPETEIRESRLYEGTLHKGYLWGKIAMEKYGPAVWARVAADGLSDIEPLAVPEAIGKPDWTPSMICRAAPDGKSLIVGDGHSLILLRFE